MSRVRARDTAPERVVRNLLTKLGYRYRLQRKDLPGSPDIAMIGRRKAIFVHGCFWHGHDCRRGARVPRTNTDYWAAKIQNNRSRDVAAINELEARGWTAIVIWECELRDVDNVAARLLVSLGPRSS